MRYLLLLALLLLTVGGHTQTALTPAQYREDFDEFWTTVKEQYAYWPEKKTDWDCVRARYRPATDSIRSNREFTGLLERVLRELYDAHMNLNTNTPGSFRLVPTGADLALRWQGGRALVREVRPRSGAEAAGIRPGMELVAAEGRPLAEALAPLLPRCLRTPDSAAQLYALQVLATGNHRDARHLTFRWAGGTRTFAPDSLVNVDTLNHEGLLDSRLLPGNVGYVNIHNSLGDEDLIPAFDSVLNGLMGTRALVLDLRETPSGGNSTVARALMGRLLRQEGYYQRHELPSDSGRWGVKRSWAEIVSPRGRTYTGTVLLLVGAWTGSMGEGIAIGLHALKRARLFGHPMAGLNGATYSFQLPHSGIGYSVSAERLYHLNGTPRELFRDIQPVPDSAPGVDGGLQGVLRFLNPSAR